MNYLLDTHGLIWFLTGDAQLSGNARTLIENEENRIFISIASLWEMAIKFSLGKLNLGKPFEIMFPQELDMNSIEILPITVEHLKTVCILALHHRDPFDRLLVAQALAEKWSIISADAALDAYGIIRVW